MKNLKMTIVQMIIPQVLMPITGASTHINQTCLDLPVALYASVKQV